MDSTSPLKGVGRQASEVKLETRAIHLNSIGTLI